MRTYQLIGITVIVALLVLAPILVAPAQAEDQMKGQGTVSQEEKGKAIEGESSLNLSTSSRSELGKDTELPMRVPDTGGETGHLQNLNAERQVFDPETLEQIRIQDEKSSVSF